MGKLKPGQQRKRKRRSGHLFTTNSSKEKYIKTMAKKRRFKVQQLLNLKKKHSLTRSEKARKTNLDVCFLTIKQKWFDEIEKGRKNREFRDKTKRYNVTNIGNKHKLLRYLVFWVRGSKRVKQYMLIEFNGLDNDHEKADTDYVMKLGEIISTDYDEIRKLAYKSIE